MPRQHETIYNNHDDVGVYDHPNDLGLSELASQGLRGRIDIIDHLRYFGGQRPSEKDILEALSPECWDDDIYLLFAITEADKSHAAQLFDWNDAERDKLQAAMKGSLEVDLKFLEPFCWDNFYGEFLVMYHVVDKTFWGYCSLPWLPYSEQLANLGDKWTDVIVKYPVLYFDRVSKKYKKPSRMSEDLSS